MGVLEWRDHVDDGHGRRLVGHFQHDMRIRLLACRNLRDEQVWTVTVAELT